MNDKSNDIVGMEILTADIVSSYVSNNSTVASELPGLIMGVHAALSDAARQQDELPKEKPKPAVPVNKSVTPDYIICLEDGKQFKQLKRHLRSSFDMSPEEYREKWGLSYDYPMVAPNYAAKRSELARQFGLGRKTGPKKRGRRRVAK